MARNKLKNGHRDRHGEILFIDARNMETEPYEDSRTQRQLTRSEERRVGKECL